jgi:hypothetical protein
MNLAEAKACVRIPDLWLHFGFDGKPKVSCRCPWREDRKPSFSVNPSGDLFHDFATGEGGDAVDFLQRASGLSKKEACRKFIELAGGAFTPTPRAPRPTLRKDAKPRPRFPDFSKGSPADLGHVATLRNLSRDGIQLAGERGFLWFATLKGFDSWIVTDWERVNAQARRMDGEQWKDIGAKAWTLPGSWANWPIGIHEAQPFRFIALTEGAPDLLAACHFIVCEHREQDCAPVAMLGASQHIRAQALPLLACKRIRIFGHDDDEGQRAVGNWARQLEDAGADVDAFSFTRLRKTDGSPVKDLNDCTSIHADDFEAERSLWNFMP